MQKIRWSLIMLILIAPLSIGCGGGGETAPVGGQDDIAKFVAENPDSGVELEDTTEPADAQQ